MSRHVVDLSASPGARKRRRLTGPIAIGTRPRVPRHDSTCQRAATPQNYGATHAPKYLPNIDDEVKKKIEFGRCVPGKPTTPDPFLPGPRRLSSPQLLRHFKGTPATWPSASSCCPTSSPAAAHITGDEKGQAQIFLDRLFRAFGQKDSLDVGGTAEMRIRKSSEDGGGTSFADYVWKPVVLIEMKRRGADLSKHYRPGPPRPRPPAVRRLCNFDEGLRLQQPVILVHQPKRRSR
jgi:hypothetical protein